jgi:hypothetical protein
MALVAVRGFRRSLGTGKSLSFVLGLAVPPLGESSTNLRQDWNLPVLSATRRVAIHRLTRNFAMSDVFISWSGVRSLQVARSMKDWIENLFQGHHAWMSDNDIQAGTRWEGSLIDQLESSKLGILCLTPENLTSQWLVFEAGALSKAIEGARVVPYRFRLREADVRPPLSLFQGVEASRDGTLKLVQSMNEILGEPLNHKQLLATFDKWWPDLDSWLREIPEAAPTPIRSDRDILEEVLHTVRQKTLDLIDLDVCYKYLNGLSREMEALEYRFESRPDAAEQDPVYQQLNRRINHVLKTLEHVKEALSLQVDHPAWRNGPTMEERARIVRGERL